jgi:ribosomal protein S27AE
MAVEKITPPFFIQSVTPMPFPTRHLGEGLSLLEFKYRDSLEDVFKAEDEKAFPKCPRCGELVMAFRGPDLLTSADRVCKCGYEFWKVFSRYDIIKF